MSDEKALPERPPTSGPGSAAAKWRAYAAAVTDSPVESWAQLDREQVIALLREQGVLDDDPPAGAEQDQAADVDEQPAETVVLPAVATVEAVPAPARRRPMWMVPTGEGPVPESEYDRRGR